MEDKFEDRSDHEEIEENSEGTEEVEDNTKEYKMSREEYEASEVSDDIPAQFLSADPSPANDISMFMIPNYQVNEELTVKSYTDRICRQIRKSAVEAIISELWDKAVAYGVYTERIERLRTDAENMNFEEQIMRGEFEIVEFVDDGDEFEDE